MLGRRGKDRERVFEYKLSERILIIRSLKYAEESRRQLLVSFKINKNFSGCLLSHLINGTQGAHRDKPYLQNFISEASWTPFGYQQCQDLNQGCHS